MTGTWTVAKSESGKRLDAWLVARVGVSRNQVKTLLDAGRVRVGGKTVRIAGWQLTPGSRVEVCEPRAKIASSFVKVLYEDADVIVVNKPAGMHSVPAPGEKTGGGTIVDQVRAYLRRKYRESGGSFVTPLHRLDVETSGALVLAKSRRGERLRSQFEHHRIEREYVAIVDGALQKSKGVIEARLEKGEFGAGKKVRVAQKRGSGSAARTEFEVQERYPDATLVHITMRTGRTHQVRVHFASLGHPVCGDKLYGSTRKFARHALHAAHLGFIHPESGKRISVRAPLPKDMEKLIDQLRGS